MRISLAEHHPGGELHRLLLGLAEHELAWVAHDGQETVRKCAGDPPDVLLLELTLPGLDGVEVTRRIMRDSPCPILIVANSMDSHAGRIFEAMGQGALDVVFPPQAGEDSQARLSRENLLKKLKTVERLRRLPGPGKIEKSARHLGGRVPRLVLLGSSTGGPKALSEILAILSGHPEIAVVVVQHVNQEFSAGLVEWLAGHTRLQVRLAVTGALPEAGNVYVAGTNDHLVLTSGLGFAYTPEPLATPYRPSVDAFFKSAASHWPSPGIAVLLTGMGRDGAEGLAALRRAGWHTIAQDRASSVVYGMPKAAKELDAAVDILPLKDIGPAILKLLG